MTITVIDTRPPVAGVTAPPPTPTTKVTAGDGLIPRGTGSEDNVRVVSWTRSSEDNGTAVERYGVEVEHVFLVPGIYTIRLAVRDERGLGGEATGKGPPADWVEYQGPSSSSPERCIRRQPGRKCRR